MQVDQQDRHQQKAELNRRKFLSSMSIGAGLLALRSNSSAAAELLLPKKRGQDGLYKIYRLSERALMQIYTDLLENACHFADTQWKDSSFERAVGFWGDGVSSGNGGIRTSASMVMACGALLRYDDSLPTGEGHDFFDKTTAALRYIVATHLTGTQKCTDGKAWGGTFTFDGGSWQSGMWTGTFAFGAWLIWDKLDPALQQGLQRVIAHECDVLSQRQPPNGLWGDTKAEENGWEVPCLVLGELMFPTHPHAASWRETARKYMMNTLCTEADTRDTTVVDGRPVNEWVKGANLQPDFTLENHHRFHPAYVACSCYFLTQAAMYYTHAGRPIPQAATHHLRDTWKMFRTIILPWGEVAYPQGMDWELHGLPYINLFASQTTHSKDRFAAHMEQSSLQYLHAWQMMGKGDLSIPGSPFGIARHAINAEQAAYGFLAHKIFGPAATELTAREAAAQEAGVRDYPYVDFIAHRTEKKFASFSWKNKIMGLLMPTGEGHEGNPDFTVPIPDGFVGSFELAPRGDIKASVVEHSRKETPDGFEASGTLLLNGGRLKQTLRMTSIGSQTVIYEDRVTALSDVTVESERGVPFGIENDEITGGTRTVSHRDGHIMFDWKKTKPSMKLPGTWANVDGRLGAIMVAGEGMAYTQASAYSAGIAVYSDILCGSHSDQVRQFKAGEEVARRVTVFFVEVTPEQTMALARSCRIEKKAGGQILHFKQPDGGNSEVQLLST